MTSIMLSPVMGMPIHTDCHHRGRPWRIGEHQGQLHRRLILGLVATLSVLHAGIVDGCYYVIFCSCSCKTDGDFLEMKNSYREKLSQTYFKNSLSHPTLSRRGEGKGEGASLLQTDSQISMRRI